MNHEQAQDQEFEKREPDWRQVAADKGPAVVAAKLRFDSEWQSEKGNEQI